MTPHYAIKAALHCATDLSRCEVESIIMARISECGTLPDATDPRHAFADWDDRESRDPSGFHGYGPHAGQQIDKTMSRLLDILERMDIECEWSDEWTSCDECFRMVRSSPNCWNWRMFGYIADGSFVCGNCIDPEEYIASKIDNPKLAVNDDLVDLANLGFTRLEPEYEGGMHPGQNDDPIGILETLQRDPFLEGNEFVFTYKPSQFYTAFTAWRRDKETEDKEDK